MTRTLSGLSILGITLAFVLALAVSHTVNAMPGTDDGLTYAKGAGGAGGAGGMGGAGGTGGGGGAGTGMAPGSNRGSIGPGGTQNGMGTGNGMNPGMGTGRNGTFGGDRGAVTPDNRGFNRDQGFNDNINPRLNQGFNNENPQPGIR